MSPQRRTRTTRWPRRPLLVLASAAAALALLLLVLPAHVDSQASQGSFSGRSSTFLERISDYDKRIANILRQIQYAIPKAKETVRKDIIDENSDKAIIGMANFLGMVFGIVAGADGNPDPKQWSQAGRIQVTAQAFYGYGYWGPFLLTFEAKTLPCGLEDLDEALDKYSFLTNMGHTFAFLDGYNVTLNGNPKKHIPNGSEPALLQYYAVELNHAMKRSLYCVTRKKCDNHEALYLSTLIDLYTQLISERLVATDTFMQNMYLKSLKKQ